jgi:hypothetical protein
MSPRVGKKAVADRGLGCNGFIGLLDAKFAERGRKKQLPPK